ncbi:MAG TPA: MerR family transcriptional regulator [Methanocorpusculum sp.]|nr:MerR family transcriptional regulator [Methanocorpusculum sp.]
MTASETADNKPKSVSAISELIGVPVDVLREIAKEYEEILPGKTIGRIKVYDDNIVDRFRKIADLQKQGCCHEVIVPAIRGGKSLEERAAEEMKRFGIENKPAIERPARVQKLPKEEPKTEVEEEILLAVRGLEQKIAAMDQRSAAIRDGGEENLRKILDAITTLSADVAALKKECHTLWDQVGELEKYLQQQAEKPFWKR